MVCSAKHTGYQPTDAEYVCPICGHRVRVDASDPQSADGCERLHCLDEIRCDDCTYAVWGEDFATTAEKIACRHDLWCDCENCDPEKVERKALLRIAKIARAFVDTRKIEHEIDLGKALKDFEALKRHG